MRRFLCTLTAAAICSVFASENNIKAQDYVPTPVTISKDKVKVDGKLYYSHIVLERQTLYSICKAYGVTVEQVNKANPGLETTGLKKNAIIFIPVMEIPKETEAENAENTVKAEKLEKAEKIEKDEKVQDAKERKKSQKEQKKREKEEKDSYQIHTVKWYEDLDSISEKYGVSIDAIMKANSLKGRKLSNRQKLRIPLGQKGGQPDIQIEEPQPADTVVSAVEDEKKARQINENALFKGKGRDKVDIVMLMPFNAAVTPHNEGSIDFYCGALLAAKEMGDLGTSIDLSVYDVAGSDILPITTERLEKSDIAIGPISADGLTALLAKCPATTAVISPLDHRAEKLITSYPNFIQAPAHSTAQYYDLIHWIKEERSENEPVIVIYEKGSRDTEETSALNELLAVSGIPHHKFSYSILEGRNITPALESMMSKDAANRVLIVSESEAFVNDVVRNLNLMIHNKTNVILYAPSKIRSFETIEIDNLHNANLHTSLSYYIDYENPQVKDFIMKYRALYNTEPSPFAYQGYDICKYFVDRIAGNGNGWIEKLGDSEREKMLQADFKFTRAAENYGFANTAIRRVVYGPEYSVKLID